MKFGVVTFPGSNCDEDMLHVLEAVAPGRVVRLWHKDHDLQGADMVMLPGGFSFGDYLRSGAIARFSPIMQEVARHAAKGGLVFGVCNGFQVLCEAGLLPGALLRNEGRKFTCRNVWLRVQSRNTPLTAGLKDQPLRIPVAHGEGRFYADGDALKRLNDEDQVLFRYCDKEGKLKEESNPNGSLENIAGICNAGRNVFGMMPHPERAADARLGNTDGLALFNSLLQTALA